MREHEVRKSGRPFGPAIQAQFVEGGKTVGVPPVNEMEAQEIVRQVRHLLFSCATSTFDVRVFVMFLRPQVRTLLEEDDDLEDLKEKRSIGIISLWHPKQAKRIDELLSQDDYISQRREQHDIRCGDARGFQGDEKDIILLSLVIGAGEKRKCSDDKAGFNVAVSRARHSLILFHSVKVGELKDGDVRKTLLEYCKNYWKEDDSTLKLKQGDRHTDWESTRSSRSSTWPDEFRSFCSNVTNTL